MSIFTRNLITVIAWLSCLLCSFYTSTGQVQGQVNDSVSGAPISYVNIQVEHEDAGATSDAGGKFVLPESNRGKTLIVSAVGYKTLRIVLQDKLKVKMSSVAEELSEVVIAATRKEKVFRIGTFKKSKVQVHYISSTYQPWILARYFPYRAAYEETPYLKTLVLGTRSVVRNAMFHLRLYKKGPDGKPGDFLYQENIVCYAAKGKKMTSIDLSRYAIRFPPDGLFIAIECLAIERNRYEHEYTDAASGKRYTAINYDPGIGALPAATNEESFVWRWGKWDYIWQKPPEVYKGRKQRYDIFAMELTLSD